MTAAGEKMQDEYQNQQYEDRMVKLGVFERHNTPQEAAKANLKIGVGVLLPNIAKVGTLLTSNNLIKTSIPFRNGVWEAFKRHAFAGGRHADLGLSVESIVAKTQSVIEQNMGLLRAGDNTITATINGVPKSFKAFVQNGEIVSVNMYPGVSNRITTGTVTNLGNITW